MWREAARYEPSMGADERAALLGGWQARGGAGQGLGKRVTAACARG